MTTHVLYHYPCADGVFGALSAYLYFGAPSATVNYVGHTVFANEAQIQVHLNSFQPQDVLYLIDYCGRQGFIAEACARLSRVVLLDHHKTAAEMLPDLTGCTNLETVVDMNRSGATISWDYFSGLRPGLGEGHIGLREKLALVEDNDLWRHVLPDSKAFATGVGELKLEFDCEKNPDIFASLLALKVAEVVETGRAATEVREARIAEVLTAKWTIKLADGKHTHTHVCIS